IFRVAVVSRDLLEETMEAEADESRLFINVTFDAGMDNIGSFKAIVIRDAQYKLLTGAMAYNSSTDPIVAEAYACLLAVTKVKEAGLEKVVLLGDGKLVIQC
ncbi:hypothetical protein Ancab_011103, partial [Ancistrocladus abbreviatus]